MHWFRGSVERFGHVLRHRMVAVTDMLVLGAMIESLPSRQDGLTVDELAAELDCRRGLIEATLQALMQGHLVREVSTGRYQLNPAYVYLPRKTLRGDDYRQAQRQRREAARTALQRAAQESTDGDS